MASIFRRIYDWLLRLFWCVLLFSFAPHRNRARPECNAPSPTLSNFIMVEADSFLLGAGRPRWTSP
jgi:hypothetical protein